MQVIPNQEKSSQAPEPVVGFEGRGADCSRTTEKWLLVGSCATARATREPLDSLSFKLHDVCQEFETRWNVLCWKYFGTNEL